MADEGGRKPTLKERLKNRVRPRRPWFAVMGAAVLAGCFLAVFAVRQTMDSDIGGEVRTSAVNKKMDTVTGGNATRNYRSKIREMNREKAEQAEERGKSYIPTVEGSRSGNDSLKKLKEKKQEPQEQKRKEQNREEARKDRYTKKVKTLQERIETLKTRIRRMQKRSRKRRKNQENTRRDGRRLEKLTQRYSNQMANLESELKESRGEQKIHVFEDAGREKTEKTKQPETIENTEPDPPELSVNPGDILYARNELKLNSDAPSPARATVVGGTYRGAKLTGGFQKQGDHLLVQFDRMVLPEGREYKIKAYAIDPEIPATAVRSDIDRHLLQRWGGLVAASFLSGFGEAVSQSGSTTVRTDGQVVTTRPEMDTEKQMWIAGGRVGDRIGAKLENSFSRPSTVTLDAGEKVGVLFLEVGK